MIEGLVHQKFDSSGVTEDLLTSTAFGLLRYLPSRVWGSLLARATTGLRGGSESLLVELGLAPDLEPYTDVKLVFWPQHDDHGEPDLLVCLHGKTARPIVFGIEVKLWSQKSINPKRPEDQLVRYWRALRDPHFVAAFLDVRDPIVAGLIYLTALDSSAETRDSVDEWRRSEPDLHFPLFELRWSAVAEVLGDTHADLIPMQQLVVDDLLKLLHALRLGPFKGFQRLADLEPIDPLSVDSLHKKGTRMSAPSDYGRKMSRAIEAVRQMHVDAAHVLRGCDEFFTGRGAKRLFEQERMSFSVAGGKWMPEGRAQAYVASPEPWNGWADAVTLMLFDDRDGARRLPQPYLIVSRAKYLIDHTRPVRDIVWLWDAWLNTPPWEDLDPRLGRPRIATAEELDKGGPHGNPSIQAMAWHAVPLFEFRGIDHLAEMVGSIEGLLT